jgi:hypothetical protein|tara:strand:+ start:164 stop:475 length:312 start_codon:yes stop_codon:yes gene_type:complete
LTEEKIREILPQMCYTKVEVDAMIDAAVEEAREIDRLSMEKHNREATIISMILGFIIMAAFVDGLLRILGIIPPFLNIDVSIIEKITDKLLDILESGHKVLKF